MKEVKIWAITIVLGSIIMVVLVKYLNLGISISNTVQKAITQNEKFNFIGLIVLVLYIT